MVVFPFSNGIILRTPIQLPSSTEYRLLLLRIITRPVDISIDHQEEGKLARQWEIQTDARFPIYCAFLPEICFFDAIDFLHPSSFFSTATLYSGTER